MNDVNKVSVIVPVYNVQEKLPRCLESILEQTYENIEIILVDDGSSDNSSEICDQYKEKYTNIKVVHKRNEGAGAARNSGLEIASGQYIMFVDSDDWIESEMFSFLVSIIQKENDVDTVSCNHYIEGVDGSNRVVAFSLNFPEEVLISSDIPKCIAMLDDAGKFNYLWNRLYKRKIIEEHQIRFDNHFTTGEDLDFNLKYFKYVRKCAVSNKPLYHYIKDGVGSLCARYKNNLYEIVTELNHRRYEFYKELGMLEIKAYNLTYERTYIDYIKSCIPNMYRQNAPLTNKDRFNQMKLIFNDKDLKEYNKRYKPNDKISKIFSVLLRIGSPRLAVMLYSILFFIRNNYSSVYENLK